LPDCRCGFPTDPGQVALVEREARLAPAKGRRPFGCAPLAVAFLATVCLATATARGQEVKPEVVLEGLANPWGLAVQPRTERLFVANSGAGEVLWVDPKQPAERHPVVTGFPVEAFGPPPGYALGPVGLSFSGTNTLVVSAAGGAGRSSVVRAYTLAKEPAAVAWDQGQPPAKAMGTGGAERFWRVAATGSEVFVAAAGPDSGWIGQLELRRLAAPPARLVEAQALSGGRGAFALALNPRGELTAALAGSFDEPRDSRLVFCGARTGRVLLALPVELDDVVDLAYSPKTGRLYAADFSWRDPAQGGVFRLDAAAAGGVTAVRVASLERTTALAISDGGALFATVVGAAPDGQGPAAGRVVRLPGTW
jgi:DNA-binding beta-propeller fold protein YncE